MRLIQGDPPRPSPWSKDERPPSPVRRSEQGRLDPGWVPLYKGIVFLVGVSRPHTITPCPRPEDTLGPWGIEPWPVTYIGVEYGHRQNRAHQWDTSRERVGTGEFDPKSRGILPQDHTCASHPGATYRGPRHVRPQGTPGPGEHPICLGQDWKAFTYDPSGERTTGRHESC